MGPRVDARVGNCCRLRGRRTVRHEGRSCTAAAYSRLRPFRCRWVGQATSG